MNGQEMHQLAQRLWPINRSLTGEGNRQTLATLKELIPELSVHEVPSGEQAFDWTIPQEWNVNDAYIITPDGQKICDFKSNNLHLLGYSIPTRQTLSLEALQQYLYSIEEQPQAIPYVTSYYSPRWGFCLSQEQRNQLKPGQYQVVVDTKLFDGSLSYGELLIAGKSKKEVFLSTYICHPSMANNELSGPVVTVNLAKWLSQVKKTNLSYRIVFIPETIGSICYISRNIEKLKENVIAGFNINCIGDDRTYSYLPSRSGETLSDKAAKHVLKWHYPDYKNYSWTERGSDERQYCSPGVDLPIASIMRSKFGEYPEYHTSLDNLEDVVTPNGLEGGFTALQLAVEAIEQNCYPCMQVFCEPQLGKRGLYPTISSKGHLTEVKVMMDLITYCDGTRTLLEIAEMIDAPVWQLYDIIKSLKDNELLTTRSTY